MGYGRVLASGEFRALFAAQLISVAGTSVAAVALTVLIYRRTHSPVLASLAFSVGFLPYLVGGGALSGVADRVRPRGLVTACGAGSAVLAGVMVWPGVPVAALLGLLFGIGCLSSLSAGSRAVLVRSTVAQEAYVPARSLMRIAAQLAQLGGNAGAGVLLLVLSPRGALAVNAVSFAVAAAMVRAVVGDHTGSAGGAPLGSWRGGKAVLAHAQLRRLLLIGWLVPMFTVAPEAVAAPYVAAHHGAPSLVGWWLTALPVGIIAGDIAGIRGLDPARQRRMVLPAAAAGFVPYLAFVADPAVPVALPLLVASGACSLYGLGLDARIRDAAPAGLFTRTMTLSSAGLMALQGLGFTAAGAVAGALGPAGAIATAGGCGLAVVALLSRPGGSNARDEG